jgi:hypothetical protein
LTDDPKKALEELRKRIALERLPKLSQDALRAAKLDEPTRRLRAPSEPSQALKLSEEARRLYLRKSDSDWLWRKA